MMNLDAGLILNPSSQLRRTSFVAHQLGVDDPQGRRCYHPHHSHQHHHILLYLSTLPHFGLKYCLVSRASPYPPRYCYYAIAEGRVWSDSTGFRVRMECVECDVIDRNY